MRGRRRECTRPRAVIPSWKIQGFSLASLVSPYGTSVGSGARHSSFGFTPLTSGGGRVGRGVIGAREKESFGRTTRKTRRSAYFIYYFARRRCLENRRGGGRIGGKKGERAREGWFANRTERHCCRLFARPSFTLQPPCSPPTPPSAPSRVGGLPSPWNKEPLLHP